jgi:hypothetical protein
MINIKSVIDDLLGRNDGIDVSDNISLNEDDISEDEIPKNLSNWLDRMETKDDFLQDLSENFRYLMNNLEDYENGDIDPKELPNFSKSEKYIIMCSVIFGCSIYPMLVDFYEVTDENGFVGVFSDENMAYKQLEDNNSGNIRTVNVDSFFNPYEYLENLRDQGLEEFAKTLEEIHTWVKSSDLKAGDCGMDECPVNTNLSRIVGYSVLFGMNWEREEPSVYAVYDSNGVHRLCVGKPEDSPDTGDGVVVKHMRDL